ALGRDCARGLSQILRSAKSADLQDDNLYGSADFRLNSMKISPQWLRDFVDLKVDYRRLADDLTLTGTAVESVSGEGEDTVFETDITTNRPDAMNHYGVARECSAIYNLPLKPIEPKLPKPQGKADIPIAIEDKESCARFTARVVHDVAIKPSPARVAHRIELMDSRPINN